MKRGHAKVFDGHKVILELPEDIPKKRKMTKSQFTAAWNKCTTQEQRVKLMKSVEPNIEE